MELKALYSLSDEVFGGVDVFRSHKYEISLSTPATDYEEISTVSTCNAGIGPL